MSGQAKVTAGPWVVEERWHSMSWAVHFVVRNGSEYLVNPKGRVKRFKSFESAEKARAALAKASAP